MHYIGRRFTFGILVAFMNFLKVFGKFPPGDMRSVADPTSKNAFGNTFGHFGVFLAGLG